MVTDIMMPEMDGYELLEKTLSLIKKKLVIKKYGML